MVLFDTFGVQASEAMVVGYSIGLADIETDEVVKAIGRAILECPSVPRPATLRKLCGKLNDPEAMAIQAWGDVLRAVPFGSWSGVDFEDRRINAAIRLLGGWPSMVERFSDSEAEKWARNDFIRAYRSVLSSGCGDEQTKPLTGLGEATSIAGVMVPPKVHRIEAVEGSRVERAKITEVPRPRLAQ